MMLFLFFLGFVCLMSICELCPRSAKENFPQTFNTFPFKIQFWFPFCLFLAFRPPNQSESGLGVCQRSLQAEAVSEPLSCWLKNSFQGKGNRKGKRKRRGKGACRKDGLSDSRNVGALAEAEKQEVHFQMSCIHCKLMIKITWFGTNALQCVGLDWMCS